ncbi:Endophilin-B1 [Nibea albiflora]|uniref:Endophilin-B1 n=1 Tax=Nibea albiflora TaxID=240163 RepID=A0ACB7FG26_NIBAL|nr:Endophilin-B1 [Nibea albiflora]
MDLTRLAVDAGQFINRAVQYTEESLGQAEKTELDPGLEELLARADATKTWTDQIISQTEVLLQPNPGARLEDRLYEHLDWSVPPRPRAHEVLGDQMAQAGLEIGSNTPYGMALLRCAEAQKQLGEAEKKFVQSTNIHFLNPLRSFTEGEYRAIQNLNASPMEEDYLSHVSYMFSFLRVKWLKMWAQEISQAEMEMRICQSLFDRQSEITRQVVEGIDNTHTNHMRCLTDFVEAQACYFDQCNQRAQELQKQLASIPAVLCSNNWQSSVSNAVYQPSTSNHVANESVGLNQGAPRPLVVDQLPEFDQDSWTLSSPPATDTSVTTQPPNQTNNNNNNTFFTNSQVTSHRSAANQAFNHACTSNSEPTDTAAMSNGTGTTTTASPPSELSGSECQTAGAVGNETITTDNMDIEASATSGTVAEPRTANDAASELPAINGEDVQESSTGSQTVCGSVET